MKKRLLSLLLAAAMLLAVVPTAAFAEGEPNVPLHINSDGKPDVTGIVPNPSDENKKVYTGDGWKYEVHPNADYLYLQGTFDLSSQPAVTCSHVVNKGTVTGGTFRPDSWTGSWDNLYPGYVENFGTISGGIFVCEVRNDTTSKISGGIFVNDPGTSNQHTIHVINGGKITKLKVGSMETAMDTENLYVVGRIDHNLELTLDDEAKTVYTVTSDMVNYGSYTQLQTPVPLVITSDGIPDISKMTQGLFGLFASDDWLYDPSDQTLCLNSSFKGSVGPNPIKCQVENAGIITGGAFYGMVSSAFAATGTIQGGIFLGKVATDQKIEGGVFVHARVNGVKKVSCPAALGKIQTITLGNDTVTLDVPVDSFYFGGTPTNLSVTLEDGTVYKNIDTSKGAVTLKPKPEEPDYYSVIVEGGIAYAHDEANTILDSETPITAGTPVTLKLLDETQGEMVFSYWDVNDNDTALADELAKTGFDKTAHETSFTMPAHDLRLVAKYRMPDEDAPQDDSFLMTAAAVTGGAVLTGLVVWQGYNIFSQVYLNAHLPEGTAIPANRQQLALLLWNTADRPEASAASYVFPDVADPDVQSAARWATEQGLLKARKDGTFAPMDSVSTGQVYRAWQKVKAAG